MEIIYQNPTFGSVYHHEISNWNTGPYTCSEVCTLITYKVILCYQELNYLKIYPGVISIQSSGNLQIKKEEEEKKGTTTEKKRRERKK